MARIPVIVGVGQLRHNRERRPADAREPLWLFSEAARRAAEDCGVSSVLTEIDTLRCVHVMSWRYDDLPGLLAQRLGCTPRTATLSPIGGNQPVALLDAAAASIAEGEARVALLCGGEAGASVGLIAGGAAPSDPWTRAPGGPFSFEALSTATTTEPMRRYGLLEPLLSYPLYENALRASLGQSFAEAQRESGELLADFSRVAAQNPAAWGPAPLSAEQIATPGPDNRMLAFPYPLRMVANPRVDQAAAVLVMDTETAHRLGIPEARWVYPLGGAGASDSHDLAERVSFSRSPALEVAFRGAAAAAEIGPEKVDVLEVYSCFPVLPKLARHQLRFPPQRRLSAAGGLNAFGGPGSAYSMHGLVAVVNALRAGARTGLVHGNGEHVTHHHVVVLGRSPPAAYRTRGLISPSETKGPPVVDVAEGAARLETFTVGYDRQGHPARAYAIGRLPNGARFYANGEPGDQALLSALTDERREAIGRSLVAGMHDGRVTVRLDGS